MTQMYRSHGKKIFYFFTYFICMRLVARRYVRLAASHM
jgi:hypothetical protein